MMSESGPSSERCSWTLLLGPGAYLESCLPYLEALASTQAEYALTGIEQLESWDALFCDFEEVGRILVDSDSVQLETLGLLRAFLANAPGWELVLVGTDCGSYAHRELLRLAGTRWLPAPLDLSSTADLLITPLWIDEQAESDPDYVENESPEPAAEPWTPPEVEDKPSSASVEDKDQLLLEVERILRGSAVKSDSPSRKPAGETIEVEPPQEAANLDDELKSELPDTPHSPPPPAPYFRHQVADLADLVQCVDMGLEHALLELEEAQGPAAEQLAVPFTELSTEVARLRQFTHTLSFLASPPSAGTQQFDLGPLLEEMLASRRGEAESPRYLTRVSEELPLRSDKILITQAFDALLFLCHVCAGVDGSVRVDGRVVETDDSDAESSHAIQVSIRFPAGRFEEFAPEQILEPYALRRELPELGANSLAAAAGILRGQGGQLELHKEPKGGLEWLVRLPLA